MYIHVKFEIVTNTLSTNTKMNSIYLSNIQYTKSSDRIRFVPYFNHQNHVKDKKIFFRLDIVCPTSIVRVSVSDTCQTRDTPFMRRVGASYQESLDQRCFSNIYAFSNVTR